MGKIWNINIKQKIIDSFRKIKQIVKNLIQYSHKYKTKRIGVGYQRKEFSLT